MSAEKVNRILEVCFSFNVSGVLYVIFPLSFLSLVHIWQILAIILGNPYSPRLLLSSHTEATCLPGAVIYIVLQIFQRSPDLLLLALNVASDMWVCSTAQSCPTLCDCSPPVLSVHGIFQARILEWVAISYPRVLTHSIHWFNICQMTLNI